jgi:hypothetical protein
VCEYVPVRIEARLGQQSGFGTNALVNIVPLAINASTFGMSPGYRRVIVSQRWSSVTIRITFGGASARAVDCVEATSDPTTSARAVTRGLNRLCTDGSYHTWRPAHRRRNPLHAGCLYPPALSR